jgi:ATP-dependent DNA helicase RecG
MPEQQNIEYKKSWHEDYLKWVCGFANAQGGAIYLGKDDDGNVVGLDEYKRLMDDLPNKIRNSMGITSEVNLLEENGKYFIEILTPAYNVPISLRGRYYFRSGSTKQELVGTSLNEFLLKKSGKTWDDIIEPRATFDDIDEKTVKSFLQDAEMAGRLPESKGLTIPELFQNLRLTENGQLKRAAIVLFGKDPAKFFSNTFVKIGRFGNVGMADLIFQEIEEGNLFQLLKGILNQLNHKFLTRKIEFNGMNRLEISEYPIDAMRESILNALVHRNYMSTAPTLIRVFDDKISFWNSGTLPLGTTLDSLRRFHSSNPRNVLIAEIVVKSGFIDSWGRGTIRILESCKDAGLPEPEMKEEDGGFMLTIFKSTLNEEQLRKFGLNDRQINAVIYLKSNEVITNKTYQEINNIGKTIATLELSKLVEFNILTQPLSKGRGSKYTLK